MKSLFKVTLLAATMAVALNAPLTFAADTATKAAPAAESKSAFKNDDQKSAYALGASLGRYMENSLKEQPAILGCEERDLSVECYGLNHFSWFTHFTVRGEEVTERLIASPELYQKTAMQYFSPELVRLCDNQLLNEYLYYY
ncbi:maltose-6'-phosphate glucosidase [Klebsiella pneumoniae]|nr:maltose-6'-phosphate glucosidase [Klebsiella pneumoniae]